MLRGCMYPVPWTIIILAVGAEVYHLLSRLSNIIRRVRPTLSKYDVYDYLCPYIGIEARG